MKILRVFSSALLVFLGTLAGMPVLAGPQPLPPVTPVGSSRPAAPITGLDRADHSASIEWNGDHVVYLTRPGSGYSPRVVRLSSTGSIEVPGTILANASQPNYLAARRIGSMVYLVYGSNADPMRLGTSYDGGRNFFWTVIPTTQLRADLVACPVIADVYGGPMVFAGYAKWTTREAGVVALWPDAIAPNTNSWGLAILDANGDPDRPPSTTDSYCPRASASIGDQIHVFAVRSNATTYTSVGRHLWYSPATSWSVANFASGASGELARGMSATVYNRDLWVSWNRGPSFHPLIGGSNNEETWIRRWSGTSWASAELRVMGTGRTIHATGQFLPTARRDVLEGNIYNSQCVGISRGMPTVVAGEALSGVLPGSRWNGLTLSRMDPVQGWLSPRLHLQGNTSAYWGSLVECQAINGRLSVGARDIFGGYRFQLFE